MRNYHDDMVQTDILISKGIKIKIILLATTITLKYIANQTRVNFVVRKNPLQLDSCNGFLVISYQYNKLAKLALIVQGFKLSLNVLIQNLLQLILGVVAHDGVDHLAVLLNQ